ncbi:hypothetical protein VTO42DRAFT_8959 [Malbranchea cinnamomea]
MASVQSKNPYELLGNDPELDPDRPPSPPVKVVDKTAPRHGKRNVAPEPKGNPSLARPPRQYGGNEGAFRDRNAGSQANRAKPTDEAPRTRRPFAGGRNRDFRGNVRDDRHSRSGQAPTAKQVDQGWGSKSGEANLVDEKAGEAIAQKEEEEESPAVEGEAANVEEPEPQEKTKSYAEYLAERAAARSEDLGVKEARKPNEGVKVDKKWESAKEFKRDEDEEAYIKGKEEKARREKQRKEKTYLDVDMRFVEQPRNRGEFRGGRNRGGDRDRGERGRGRRGEGAPRGGGRGPTVDEKNFPSLGSAAAAK